MVVTGSVLVAGWSLLPIILFGVDPTLDPTRFATFAVRERTLAVGLVLTALVGLPGVATILLVLGTVVAGSRSVAATLAALVGGLLGLLTCVLLSRIVTAAAAAVLATRRGRDVAGVGGLLLFIVAGPIIGGLSDGGIDRATLDSTALVLAWTPLGWAWAAAGDITLGEWSTGLTHGSPWRRPWSWSSSWSGNGCSSPSCATHGRRPRTAARSRRVWASSDGSRRRRWVRSQRGRAPTGSATPASTSPPS